MIPFSGKSAEVDINALLRDVLVTEASKIKPSKLKAWKEEGRKYLLRVKAEVEPLDPDELRNRNYLYSRVRKLEKLGFKIKTLLDIENGRAYCSDDNIPMFAEIMVRLKIPFLQMKAIIEDLSSRRNLPSLECHPLPAFGTDEVECESLDDFQPVGLPSDFWDDLRLEIMKARKTELL